MRMRKVLASCVVCIFNSLPMKVSVTEGRKGGALHQWSGPPWSIRGPECGKGARTVVMGTDYIKSRCFLFPLFLERQEMGGVVER